jgi:sarcosine/dimethylglycine N-methyltransferase
LRRDAPSYPAPVHAAVSAYYDHHPITAEQVLGAVRAEDHDLAALRPEDLFPHDQDHYGGTAAVDRLAERCAVDASARVLDVCAGLGGPARYLAARYGCRVAGVDLTFSRCAGARRLTELVGLADRVAFAQGDAVRLPFADGAFDACVSQEAFLHVADKAALLAEARRVLRPGGRLAFTDWVARPPLTPADRDRLVDEHAATGVVGADQYVLALTAAGLDLLGVEDLSAEWAVILDGRLAMYRRISADGPADFVDRYAFLVQLVRDGRVGGSRFVARRPE